MTAYVHNISPVKKSRGNNKIEYYNMNLQTEANNFRSVSHRIDLHKRFSDAAQSKSPVKITKFKHVANFFNKELKDVEINRLTKLDAPTSVNFEHQLPTVKPPPLSTIAEILELKQNKDVVTIRVYLDVDSHPSLTTSSQFHSKPVLKKEVSANDDTGTIKLTLWEDKVIDAYASGVYELSFVNIKEFPNGGRCLNTSSKSIIKKLNDVEITPSTVNLPDLNIIEIKFPPDSIHVTKFFVCGNCEDAFSSKDANVISSIIKCPKCSMLSRKEKFTFYYQLKLVFRMETGEQCVNMYKHQVESYYRNKKAKVTDDEDELVTSFLSDDITTIICNARYTCIGIKA